MAKRKFEPVHPGVVLAEDFFKGLFSDLVQERKRR
jgi:hypothetical protein